MGNMTTNPTPKFDLDFDTTDRQVWRDAYRAFLASLTTEQKASYFAERDAKAKADNAAREAFRLHAAQESLKVRYSDATLTANLDSSAPGLQREAHILLTVPENLRQAIVAEAHYLANVLPCYRWSDALSEARTHILAGRPTSSTAKSLLA